MTNEEIRLNRYCKHCRNYDKGCDWLCGGMICNEADAYELALDEKDQQFKEYLERMRDYYQRKYELLKDDEPYQIAADEAWCKWHNTEEIINELFGGE